MKIFTIILCLWFLVKDSNSENIVRLVNGKTQDEGFIQIRYNDTWGTLLDYRNMDNEPLMNAFVVCRMLNYTKAIKGDAVWYNPYAANSTYWPRALRCTGREETICDCYTTIPINFNMAGSVTKDPPYSAVYAVCGSLSKVDKTLQVRLVDTILKNVGIVETTYAWPWQKICIAYNWVSGIQWASKDANVVCKMLGYRSAIGGFIYKISMRADPKSLVHNVVSKQYHCTGKEATIAECAQADRKYCSKSYLDSNYYVGAFCENNEIPPSVEFRISGDKEPNIGFLEVKHRGVWATVCTTFSELNRTATDFICRQLGYLGIDGYWPYSGNNPKTLISWELNKSCAISKRGNCSHGDTWKVYRPGPCEYPKTIACKVAAVPRYHIIEGCQPRLVINRTGLTLKEKRLITYYQVILWQYFGPEEHSSFYISGNTTLLNIGDNKTYVKNMNRPLKTGEKYAVKLRAVYEDENGNLGYGNTLHGHVYNLPSFEAINCSTAQGPTTGVQSTTANEKASDIAPESSRQPLRTGEIVGIVIGVLFVIAIVAVVIFIYKNRKVPQGAEDMKLNPVPENPEL